MTADGPESEPAAEHLVGGIPLASLVRDFHRPMLKFARTMVNSPALAEEAVQEAWVQVLQSSSSFEGRSYLSIPVALAGAARSALPRPGQPPKRIGEGLPTMTVYDNTVPAIDCVDFVRLVDDLVDCDPQQRGAIVAKHLDECPPCLVYLQQMLDLKVLLNHVFDGDNLSEDDIAGVVNAITTLRNGHES